MNESPAVLLDVSGAVATLTLNRPPLNILDLDTIGVLDSALARVEESAGIRAIVLRAQGKAFCAGVSVKDHLPPSVGPMLSAFHGVFHRLRRIGCPMVAAVDGAALGGGCELVIVADWVIATPAARLGFPEIRLAALPPVATVQLSRRVGPARALQLILSGEELTAEDACAIGLVDAVVAREDLDGAVNRILGALETKSASALRLAKKAFEDALGRSFADGLERTERLYLQELMKTHDAVEGLEAFLEKRPARWRNG
jgi:cyclohexa-1,5-dienecarbonyl-CoA hydratase